MAASSGLVRRRVRVAQRVVSGDVALPNTAGVWQPLAGFSLPIPAVAGDDVELDFSAMRTQTSGAWVDIGIVVGGSIVWFATTDSATPPFEGDTGWYPVAGFALHSGDASLIVGASHLSGGNVTFVVAVRAAGAGSLFASANYPFRWKAVNHGQ